MSFERLEDRRLLSLAPLAVWLPSDRPPESPIQAELTDVDAKAPGEIRGIKWNDADADGIRDPGEAGLAGVTIYLDLDQDGEPDAAEPSTVTLDDDPDTPGVDETGTYQITGLAPATYTVAEVLPEQHEQTFPAGSQGSGRLTFRRMHRDGEDGVDGLDGAVAVAMSPDGGHVYAVGNADHALTVFRRDAASGELDFVQVIRDGTDGVTRLSYPTSMCVSPDGQNVYAASHSWSAVWVFGRDPLTGELSFRQVLRDGQDVVYGLEGLTCVTVSADGRHVYTTAERDDALAVFSRDAATGELTPVQAIRETGLDGATSVAVSPDGYHVFATGAADDALVVFHRDAATGEVTFLEVLRDGYYGADGLGGASSVAVSRDGRNVYAAGADDDALTVFRRSFVTGELSSVQVLRNGQDRVRGLDRVKCVTISPDGSHVYAAGENDNALAVFRRDPATGQLTYVHRIGSVDWLAGVRSAVVSPDGKYVYSAAYWADGVAAFQRDGPVPGTHQVDVAPDQVVENVDFGNRPYPVEIHGFKWNDFDADGRDDGYDDRPLAGVTIYLDLNENGRLDPDEPSTLTRDDDPDTPRVVETGGYHFTELPPGTYTVAEVLARGFEQTFPATTPDPPGTYRAELAPGQRVLNLDFGNRLRPDTVYGTKWNDLDGDGERNVGEPAVVGVTVYLDFNENGQLDPDEPSAVTPDDDPLTLGVDETGTYCFGDLEPGVYTVAEVLPDEHEQIFPGPDSGETGMLVFEEFHRNGQGGLDGLDGANSVAPSPDGQHVYVTAGDENALAVFRRDVATGELTHQQMLKDGYDGVEGLDGAGGVAVSPDGNHVYVAGEYDDALAVFRRDAATGRLSPVQVLRDGQDAERLDGVRGVAVTPDGCHVYTASRADHAISAFSRDTATGQLTPVQAYAWPGLGGATAVAVSPDGNHVYLAACWDDAVSVFRRDAATGWLSLVQTVEHGPPAVYLDGPYGVAVSPDGSHVYAVAGNSDSLMMFRRNADSGRLTRVGVVRGGNVPGGVDGLDGVHAVTVSPDGKQVYTAGYAEDAVVVFRRDPDTGWASFVEVLRDGENGVDGLDGTYAVRVSADGKHLYAVGKEDDALAVFRRHPGVPATHQVRITPSRAFGNADFGNRRLPAEVVGRHVFYNNSAFDGNHPEANPQDDEAIAPDKVALMPGQTATLANYTSYSRGMNGIVVDVANLPPVEGQPDAGEYFEFRAGNDDGPAGWDLAPDPTCLAVRDGQGTGGCDRVTVIWPDGAIQKQWLQVTVLANSSTGLDEPDVFYFGNAVGESGNSTAEAKVNAYDMLGARDNQRTFADLAPLDFPYDYNRDMRVDAYDMLIARDNQTHFLNALKLITIPMVGQGTCPTIGRDGEGTGLPVFSGVEIPPATPARLDWLYELDQISAHRQPAERDKSAEPITDAWLAAFHCG